MGVYVVGSSAAFRWKGKMYQVGACGVDDDGVAFASTTPDEPDLVAEIKRRVLADGGLTVYLGNGYQCFVEDRLTR